LYKAYSFEQRTFSAEKITKKRKGRRHLVNPIKMRAKLRENAAWYAYRVLRTSPIGLPFYFIFK